MTRIVRLVEPGSGLSARCRLLDDKAPLSAEFLWQLANREMTFDAMNAMWTGPELSCPLPASVFPSDFPITEIPQENATSYPKTGEVVLAYLAAGSVQGLPPGPFFDLGVFYDAGGRLLMQFGWIMANVCAEIIATDLPQAQKDFRTIRSTGACKLTIQTA
jgi:Protein of unknown function (DUF3830)